MSRSLAVVSLRSEPMATLADGRTIPFDWYSDPAVLRLERERIFQRTWQYAGRTDQVAEPGAFFTCDLGGVPIVVVRDKEGGLRAFLNVCRHRGSLVCEGEGKRETLQCPYHAWTYDLDGSLRAAPRSEREPGFDKTELGLVPASVGSWGPFVFVNPDGEAAPLADTLGELPERVAASGLDLDSLRFLERSAGEYEANWKVCSENFLECYHCQVAHPGFSKVVDVSVDAYVLEQSGTFSTQYGPVREAWKGDFDPTRPDRPRPVPLPLAEPDAEHHAGAPEPLDRADRADRPGADGPLPRLLRRPGGRAAWIDDMLEFDAQVGAEDTVLVERVQKGMRGAAGAKSGARPADGRKRAPDRALPELAARRTRLTAAQRGAVNIW